MKRRNLIKSALQLGVATAPLSRLSAATGTALKAAEKPFVAGPKRPVTIYNNWSAYDELSDTEIRSTAFNHDLPLEIKCMSTEQDKLTLKAEVYAIHY